VHRRIATALAALLSTGLARAEELPPRGEALLALRLLAYDRALPARARGGVRVAVLLDDGEAPERDLLVSAVADVARGYVLAGRAVTAFTCPWRGADALHACLDAGKAAALLVPERLGDAAAEIARATRAAGVLSFATDRRMIEAGLAVGLVQRASRSAVVVNLAAARQEGADLDASLFAVAEVLGR
jgi:hypothetical protein